MQPRPRATFLDGTSVVHPGQEDPTNAIIPPAVTQQVHRLVNNPQHFPTHGWSCGDAHNALRRSHSSSSSFSFSQRDTKLTTTSNINPYVVKVPLSHYKTEYCTKFRELGQCPFGERCLFVHHDSELQRKERALTYKTRPCWSGTSCQYQMNHSRCVYLHGDETAEMFDEQRGISFARVQKILAAKEVKQQHRRQQQQQQAQTQEQCRSSLLEQSSSTESLEAASSQEGGQELESEGRAAELKESTIDEPLGTPVTVFVPRQQKTLQRSFSYPLSTPKRTLLTIVPPSLQFLLNNDKNNDTAMGSITMATTHPLADLFSPGEMPFIETPFPSHDRINEWKDPCFEDEDSEDSGVDGVGTAIRVVSSSLHRPTVAVPPSSSSASMLGSLGMMVFYSDTIPTNPSVTTDNQLALDLHLHLQAQNHTQQDAVAFNSLACMMDVFSFWPS
ncbi:hypothetical protein KI688_009987 [Linnemannia hyalina]|uniref:C3H1-type domain-containing protein n=1 Tax=Linnemannia hyalina TaxID=64524 RepID=A0A9P7XXS5_9FUNG|nr:hypothetical protein KI688_009987 [Linnemannia hyalina]